MNRQNDASQKLKEENAKASELLKHVHKITTPTRKILHLPKKKS